MAIKIGNREIGDKHPCFITFEAGPTHDGVESAKTLFLWQLKQELMLLNFRSSIQIV
jgi:hypothetical protein